MTPVAVDRQTLERAKLATFAFFGLAGVAFASWASRIADAKNELGLGAGVLSALLGVGGGGVVVPVLMVWFGIGDLSAKGASLVMMLPGVASGLVANLRKQFVDVRLGLMIGAAAVVSSPLGVWVAHAIPPQPAAWLFAGFLLFVGGTMAREALRPPAA